MTHMRHTLGFYDDLYLFLSIEEFHLCSDLSLPCLFCCEESFLYVHILCVCLPYANTYYYISGYQDLFLAYNVSPNILILSSLIDLYRCLAFLQIIPSCMPPTCFSVNLRVKSDLSVWHFCSVA